MIHHFRKIVPRRIRRYAYALLDRHLPLRLRLPFIYYALRLQGGLEEEMYLLDRIVPREKLAVDIGANIGLYSFRLAALCRGVESFEPNADCAAVLQAWRSKRVRVHVLALSSISGPAELSIPVEGAGFAALRPMAARERRQVQVERLDEFNLTPVGFIKIDVEGHETEVLRGALDTIRRERPILLIEVEQRHRCRDVEEVFDLLEGEGYRGTFLRDGRLHKIETFSVETDQRAILRGSATGKYVNNFLFFPANSEGLTSKPLVEGRTGCAWHRTEG